MNRSAYEFHPLTKQDGQSASYIVGHAIIWDPRQVRMELIVSHDALARDCYLTTFAPHYQHIEPWKELIPLNALNVRQAVELCQGGIAYFNAGESGVVVNPLIQNGKLLTKTNKSRAIGQMEWEPLNGSWTFFLQHADGCAEILDLRPVDDEIHPDDLRHLRPGTNGFSVPYVMRAGKRIGLKNPPPGCTAKSGETLYTMGAPAAISAIGLTSDGRAVRIALIGDTADPTNWTRAATFEDLCRFLADFGVTDAVFAGASADVQTFEAQSRTLAVAAERPKEQAKKWVLMPGQTERGVTCIAKLVVADR